MNSRSPLNVLVMGDQTSIQISSDLPVYFFAKNTQDLMQQLDVQDFDLVLLTHDSAGSVPLEAATLLRSQPRAATIPIIIISDTIPANLPLEPLLALGGIDVLPPSLLPLNLKNRIDGLIELQRTRDQLLQAERRNERAVARGQQSQAAFERRVVERISQLFDHRAFLAAVLETIEDGVVACGADGVLALFNRATRELHQLAETPLPPEQWAEHFGLYRADGKTLLTMDEVPLYRALCGERIQDVEMVIAPANTAPRTVLVSGGPLNDNASGRKLGAVVSMHDVTALRAANLAREAAMRERARMQEMEKAAVLVRESKERFALLLESSGEGIYGICANGICTFINQAGASMLGYQPAELVGRSIDHLINDQRVDGEPCPLSESSIGQAALSGKATRVDDGVFWHKAGTAVPVSYSLSPMIVGGNHVGAVIIYTDITERHQAAETLRVSEERVRLATDASGLGVWVWDVQANTVSWENEHLHQMFGLPASIRTIDAKQFVTDYLHPEDAPTLEKLITQTLESGDPFQFEGRFFRQPDRALRWVEFTGRLQPSSPESPPWMLGTAGDITQRKHAEEQERRATAEALAAAEANAKFRAFFEQGSYFAGIMKVDGTLVEANRLCLDACGFTREDVIGRKFWDCGWWNRSPELMQLVQDGTREAAAGRRFQQETRYFVADGCERYTDLILTPVTDDNGRVLFIAPSGTDITERKRTEEALRLMAAELAEADRRKTEFLATLAHELRNPLAPILNGIEVMRLSSGQPAMLERVRSMMARQLQHMVHLVDDLLDIARITRGKVELKKERIDVPHLINSAIETCLPLLTTATHELELQLPEQALLLDVDPTRVTQVISNLLNNAAKYTPAGGRIQVCCQRVDDNVQIIVTDNGIGIPAAALGSIFDMFTQVEESIDRTHGGLGIGLTLVRRLVELHGGSVSASSAGRGQGSSFSVTLPLASSDEPTARPSEIEETPKVSQALKVLIVDDNVDAAESLAALLHISGHKVQIANNGSDALDIAPKLLPHVVFLDIGMAGMNGHEVARALRKRPDMARVILVALTGWGAEHDRALTQAAGFDQHLTKPAEPTVINSLLARLAPPQEAMAG